MNKSFVIDYLKYDSLTAMPQEDRELVAVAKKALESAFAPYSGFKVGAAALLKSGRVVTGSNQESEVFPAGICAERSLLFHYQAHDAHDPIVALAIASLPDQRECYPCGMCRQVIIDTEKRQGQPMKIIMSGADSATVLPEAKYLLPFLFEL